MNKTLIDAASEISDQERQTVIDGLVQYNTEQGHVWDRKPLNVLARSADGRVVGGLLGEVNHRWLFVAALWVDRDHRNEGLGTLLLREAENQARQRGCLGVFLDTYSFQARPFYERLGYSVFGKLDDCPPGETKFYLARRI